MQVLQPRQAGRWVMPILLILTGSGITTGGTSWTMSVNLALPNYFVQAHRSQWVDHPVPHYLLHQRLRWLYDERSPVFNTMEGSIQLPDW